MTRIIAIFKKEIQTTLSRKSYLFALFGLPLIAAAVFIGIDFFKNRQAETNGGQAGDTPAEMEVDINGYIDLAGIIQDIPPDFPNDIYLSYPDEETAMAAVEAGRIAGFFIVPEDYLETGDLVYVNDNFSPVAADNVPVWNLRWLLDHNLLIENPQLLSVINEPMMLEEKPLSPSSQQETDDNNPLAFFIPYANMLIFYMIIMSSGSLLMSSVATEKQNRVMEVLLSTVSPRELLIGKFTGLGVLGLLQAVVWLGSGYLILQLQGKSIEIPQGMGITPELIALEIVFFFLGYGQYATLMAGLGALVPDMKDASSATFIVIAPLLVPMFLISILATQPHSPIAIALSLFPLTAPVAMVTRLAAGGVPIWQIIVSILLQAGSVAVIIRGVEGFFHTQTLLSGEKFSAKRFFKAFVGKI